MPVARLTPGPRSRTLSVRDESLTTITALPAVSPAVPRTVILPPGATLAESRAGGAACGGWGGAGGRARPTGEPPLLIELGGAHTKGEKPSRSGVVDRRAPTPPPSG